MGATIRKGCSEGDCNVEVTPGTDKVSIRYVFTHSKPDSVDDTIRNLLIEIDGEEYFLKEYGSIGQTSTIFSKTIKNLIPNKKYTISFGLGWGGGNTSNWNPLTNHNFSVSFTTDPAVGKWSWEVTNGDASDEQTQIAYQILMGEIPADDFSHLVWNDLINMVSDLRVANGLDSWDTDDNYYLSKSACLVEAGDTLSAAIYNSLLYNVEGFASTDLSEVQKEDKLTGSAIIGITSALG